MGSPQKHNIFNSNEQLLSIMRDENIMNPKTLVFKNKLGEDPDFGSDKLKYIHGAEWDLSVCHYYNIEYGYNKNRVIYGVIFAIDKAYTDQEDRLCFKSVKFSL